VSPSVVLRIRHLGDLSQLRPAWTESSSLERGREREYAALTAREQPDRELHAQQHDLGALQAVLLLQTVRVTHHEPLGCAGRREGRVRGCQRRLLGGHHWGCMDVGDAYLDKERVGDDSGRGGTLRRRAAVEVIVDVDVVGAGSIDGLETVPRWEIEAFAAEAHKRAGQCNVMGNHEPLCGKR
jgi:hypothetical protein